MFLLISHLHLTGKHVYTSTNTSKFHYTPNFSHFGHLLCTHKMHTWAIWSVLWVMGPGKRPMQALGRELGAVRKGITGSQFRGEGSSWAYFSPSHREEQSSVLKSIGPK